MTGLVIKKQLPLPNLEPTDLAKVAAAVMNPEVNSASTSVAHVQSLLPDLVYSEQTQQRKPVGDHRLPTDERCRPRCPPCLTVDTSPANQYCKNTRNE